MPIHTTNTPPPQRQITQVDDAISQLPSFSDMYRQLFDAVEGGALGALIDPASLAVWRRNIRLGVINTAGRPIETEFFRILGGGTPKPTQGTDLTIEYNGPIDLNIYAASDVSATYGTVTGCDYGSKVNASYTGYTATFQIAAGSYADNGTKSNINVRETIYNFADGHELLVIKVDKSVPGAHLVTVTNNAAGYIPQIYGGKPMFPEHVQFTTGYSDITTQVTATDWETLGYFKVIQPFNVEKHSTVPCDLLQSYKDVLQFALIFDPITGEEMWSWELKMMDGLRREVFMAENVKFFVGEATTNSVLVDASASYTNKYFGFEGFLPSIMYGGGIVNEYNNAIGYDIDIQGTQTLLANDALKLSTELLMLNSKKFQLGMERRSQDLFKNNSGTCMFQTFSRAGAMDADIVRKGVQSYAWGGSTTHFKEVGMFSDSRAMGNDYVTDLGILLQGTGMLDSKGQAVSPVEFYLPEGMTESGQYKEIVIDERRMQNRASQITGSVYHQIMMAVHGVENMVLWLPEFVS